MDNNLPTLEQKTAQLNDFYMLPYAIKVNVLHLSEEQMLHDYAAFESNMPYAFKIATELSEIEAKSLRPLRKLGEKLDDLVEYLQLQAKKIDLMMSYILQQQDQVKFQHNTHSFGGGGLIIEYNSPVKIGERRAIKLFLESESAAIYTYMEAVLCEPTDTGFIVSYIFTHIRPQDQELLVRASLHLQTLVLRKHHQDQNTE